MVYYVYNNKNIITNKDNINKINIGNNETYL